jgi:hypothetical protein
MNRRIIITADNGMKFEVIHPPSPMGEPVHTPSYFVLSLIQEQL